MQPDIHSLYTFPLLAKLSRLADRSVLNSARCMHQPMGGDYGETGGRPPPQKKKLLGGRKRKRPPTIATFI